MWYRNKENQNETDSIHTCYRCAHAPAQHQYLVHSGPELVTIRQFAVRLGAQNSGQMIVRRAGAIPHHRVPAVAFVEIERILLLGKAEQGTVIFARSGQILGVAVQSELVRSEVDGHADDRFGPDEAFGGAWDEWFVQSALPASMALKQIVFVAAQLSGAQT